MNPLMFNINDHLRDNDPREPGRSLTVVELCRDAKGTLTHVAARERPGSKLVRISVDRIFPEGPPRRTGFTLQPAPPLDPRIAALLGKAFLLCRGSRCRATGPGCERSVRARLDQVDGNNVFATLLEDDPLATVTPFKAGESGLWHGFSFVGAPA